MTLYIEDMVTFTALVKIFYSSEYFCNAKVAGFWQNFHPMKRLVCVHTHTLTKQHPIELEALGYMWLPRTSTATSVTK